MSPAWPISYDELEPYYTLAEQRYEVHGNHGEDPTEPPASAQYPFPAVSHEPRIQQLSDDLAAAGYHPFHAPCGIRLNEADMPHSACVRCMNCDGFPCVVHGKSDADVLGIRPALEHPNVTLLTGAVATRVETNPAGTAVTGVVVERDGATETFTGDLVVLACGAANTAKLLLMSANDKHPNGLANASDQVGRNYMFHNSQAVLALSREENPTIFQKTLGLNDFYFAGDRLRVPARQHPDGRQVAGADVPRREAGRDAARAAVVAREHRPPRDRLLALDRGPAPAREPGDGRRRGSRDAALPVEQRRPQAAALLRAQVDPGQARHGRRII